MSENYAYSGGDRLRLAWVTLITPQKLDVATWIDTTKELRKQGVDVTLITMGPENEQPYPGIEVLSIPRPHIYFLGQALYHLGVLRHLLRNRHHYDVVLFHQISAIWLLPLRLLGKRRPLLVMDTRDLLDFDNRTFKARLRNNFERFTYRLAPHAIDGQTAITQKLAELVGIPPSQLWGIWPSGVIPENFRESRERRQWPETGTPIRLIYIGIMLEQRNLLPLAKAVVRANAEGMDFVLSLYGDGAFRPELEAYAAQTGGMVRVEKPVPFAKIPSMLALAHVGVTSLPTQDNIKYEASSPLKMFEYMAAGMPMISTRNRCHTDVVRHGNYVFWADEPSEDQLFSALQQAWAARERLPELGSEAFEAVADWTWAESARKLNLALKEGLNSSWRRMHAGILTIDPNR